MSATEWKFVPVEPTEEMLREIHLVESFTGRALIARYTAMLAAAPVPPSVESLLENWTPSDQKAFAKFRDEHFPGEMSSHAIQSLGSAWKNGQANAALSAEKICRTDGRCEYAIQAGIEGLAQCQAGKCSMPQPAHLTIPGALEWDGDNCTHGVVGTHSAGGESRAHGESAYTAVDMTTAAAGGFRDGQKAATDSLKAFANELIAAAFEGGSFDGGDIQEIAVKHGLLRIKQRAEECGEVCACREYGFPAECYRKTDLLKPADELAAPDKCEPSREWTDSELTELFSPGSGNKARRRIEAIQKAKPKTCIECDQPYCHGVCVERGDQDYDRDQAAKGGDQ